MKPVFGRGLSVLWGIFALKKNRYFTGVLRGCRGQTKAEQDKAGSLGPASLHRPATPVGDYGYVKGIPGQARFAVRVEIRSLTAFSGRFSGKFRQGSRHRRGLHSRANAGIIQDGKDGINGKTDNPDALEGRQNAR